MQAMILAAGRGSRMRHLTRACPKPLLKIKGKRMIEYHLEHLVAAGITRIIINTAYLGQKIVDALGDGTRYGADIIYSHETELGLETAGGIINALPLLTSTCFIVINADIFTDYPFAKLHLRKNRLAHVVLVANPEHNPNGDFSITEGLLSTQPSPRYTFAGISCFHREFFSGFSPGHLPLKQPLIAAIAKSSVTAELYSGRWLDVGTPERLQDAARGVT